MKLIWSARIQEEVHKHPSAQVDSHHLHAAPHDLSALHWDAAQGHSHGTWMHDHPRRRTGAEVVVVEDQAVGQVLLAAEQHPAHPGVHQAVPAAGRSGALQRTQSHISPAAAVKSLRLQPVRTSSSLPEYAICCADTVTAPRGCSVSIDPLLLQLPCTCMPHSYNLSTGKYHKMGALVARGVDGDDVGQAEVPLQVGVQEGHHEAAAGAVDVDLDVPAVLLVYLACAERGRQAS